MSEPKKYTLTVERYCWDCGDGCCSDSWYVGELRDAEDNYITEYDGEGRRPEDVIESLLEQAKQYKHLDITEDDCYIRRITTEEGKEYNAEGWRERIEYEDY